MRGVCKHRSILLGVSHSRAVARFTAVDHLALVSKVLVLRERSRKNHPELLEGLSDLDARRQFVDGAPEAFQFHSVVERHFRVRRQLPLHSLLKFTLARRTTAGLR